MTPDDPQARPDAATETSVPPAQDTGFRARHLPGTPAGDLKGMLPGLAVIGVYLLLFAMLRALAPLRGLYGAGLPAYGILGVCPFMLIGVFGFLRLRRW